MRVLLFIGLLLPLSMQSQNNDQLFMQVWEQCPLWFEEHVDDLCQDFQDIDSLNYWLDSWELYCEPSVASIRHRLLGDLEFKGAIADSLDLSAFILAQTEVAHAQYLDSALRKHHQFTKEKAQELLTRQNWPAREEYLLKLIASESHNGALDLPYQKSYYPLEEAKEVRKGLKKKQVSEVIKPLIGYNYLRFNQELAEELVAGHGLVFGLDLEFEKDLLSMLISFNRSERRSYQRILEQGQVVRSDLETLIGIDLNYGRRLLEGRRSRLDLYLGGGANSFTTDLIADTSTDEEESHLSISSYHFNLGLNYRYRIYGSQQIGLRCYVSFTNYNQDQELRGNLNGQTLVSSLYYRF